MRRPLLLLGLMSACNLPESPFDPLGWTASDAGPPTAAPTEHPPAALSGGTLAVAGPYLTLADPDRDRVLMVHLLRRKVVQTIEHAPEPGRVLAGQDGRFHVVLRGSGEVLSFTPYQDPVRTPVCATPRGLAEVGGTLWVTCAGGALYALEAGHARLLGRPATDLRDLAVVNDRVFASRFRTAEILELDHQGQVLRTLRPPVPEGAQAAVAWRLVATQDRRLALLHQLAHPTRPQVQVVAYYGDGDPCAPLVMSALTVFDPDVAALPAPMQLAGAPLALDVAVDRNGRAAVAAAGRRGAGLVAPTVVPATCQALPRVGAEDTSRHVAVVETTEGFAFQSLEPPRLTVVPDQGAPWTLELGGASAVDPGHALFHDATAAGLACASCHPEGGDDGVVWQLGGPRRTQFLAGGLNAPFHWVGDLPDLNAFLGDVFTQRMQGGALAADQIDAFGQWLEALPTPVAEAPADPEAAERGRALFFGAAGCAACHQGGDGVDGQAHDIGRGEPLQTPALRHLAARTHFMHDGCAETLADRFRPACGGDRHGNTADLDPAALADLIAFLETL